MTHITERISQVRNRLEEAARAAGRTSDDIRLVAVSNQQPAESVAAAMQHGLGDFGENYLQEAMEKVKNLGDGPIWHYIGRIQTNKTRAIAENFQWVQTLCSFRQARRRSQQRPPEAGDLQVCIQVAPTGAPDRAGVTEPELPKLAEDIQQLPRVQLRGLMILPLAQADAERQRPEFARVRRLLDSLNDQGHSLDTLSMGMSDDLEVAIMEGSNMIRIGTAIFGPRDKTALHPSTSLI